MLPRRNLPPGDHDLFLQPSSGRPGPGSSRAVKLGYQRDRLVAVGTCADGWRGDHGLQRGRLHSRQAARARRRQEPGQLPGVAGLVQAALLLSPGHGQVLDPGTPCNQVPARAERLLRQLPELMDTGRRPSSACATTVAL